jgi:hypothetical protein
MAINKVEYSGNTLIDLTSDSVTPESLLPGVTAHDKSGNPITGTFDSDKYLEKTGDASNTTVTFTQATSRTNIYSKEKLSVIMGKIAKFFADLKTVAVTGKYSDLSGTPGVVSKTANGLCPKNGGTTTKFLRDDGTYAEPTASVSGLSTLEQVTAAATAGNVTDPVGAGAVNELNSSFAYDENGIYGYRRKVDGADTVFPFKSGLNGTVEWLDSNDFNIPSDVDSCIVIALLGSYAQNYVPNMNHTLTLSKGDSTLLLDKVFLSTNIDGWWIKGCIKIFYLTNCKGSNVTCSGNYNHIMLY